MTDDFLIKKYFMNSNPKYRFGFYIFLYQGTQYRPSWTEEVILDGSLVYILHYSSSSEPHLDGKSYDNILNKISTWPIIIPFNRDFCQKIKNNVNLDSKVLSNPTIFFGDNGDNINKYVKKPYIAIFDIYPLKEELYIGYSSNLDYLFSNPEDDIIFYKKFFNDILEIGKKYQLQLVLKPKRNDPRIKENYKSFLFEMTKSKDLIILPSEISPYKVVEKSFISIVQPFSSVGFYKEKNNNIIFYDPLYLLDETHRERKNTELIVGKENLNKWFIKLEKLIK